MTSTIDALKNILDGKAPGDFANVKLGGPDAPKPDTARATKAKEYLANLLKDRSWVIEFTKVDSTPATMECTLDPTLLPASELQEQTTSPQAQNETVLRVYSLDRQGWRSFKVLNVTKIYRKPGVL